MNIYEMFVARIKRVIQRMAYFSRTINIIYKMWTLVRDYNNNNIPSTRSALSIINNSDTTLVKNMSIRIHKKDSKNEDVIYIDLYYVLN